MIPNLNQYLEEESSVGLCIRLARNHIYIFCQADLMIISSQSTYDIIPDTEFVTVYHSLLKGRRLKPKTKAC